MKVKVISVKFKVFFSWNETNGCTCFVIDIRKAKMCHYNSLGWKIPVNLHNITEVTITLAEKIITDVPLGPCFQKVLKKYLLRVQSRVLPKCSFPRPKYEDDELNSIFFVVWLTDERHLALFPAGTIVREPSRVSDTPRTGFKPAQSLSSG